MRRIATSILLLALLAPAGCAPERRPMEGPFLDYTQGDGRKMEAAPGGSHWQTGWHADTAHPDLYVIGMDTDAGAAKAGVPFIAQRGASGDRPGGVTQVISADTWRGERVRLTARLKSRNAVRVRLWLSALLPRDAKIAYDSGSPIRGTTDWQTHEVVMDVPANALSMSYGFFVAGDDGFMVAGNDGVFRAGEIRDGKGMAWGDSFTLEKVDRATALSGVQLASRTREVARSAPNRNIMTQGWGFTGPDSRTQYQYSVERGWREVPTPRE